MRPVSIAIVGIGEKRRFAVASAVAEALEIDLIGSFVPEFELTQGNHTKMSLADLGLSHVATVNLSSEIDSRIDGRSFVTESPPVLSLAFCGDLYERLGQNASASVMAQTRLLQIRSVIQHLSMLASTASYSGIYYLSLPEDADENLKRIDGHLRLALEATQSGYRTIDGDDVEAIADLIVTRVRRAMSAAEDDADSVTDTNTSDEDGDEISDGQGTGEAGE